MILDRQARGPREPRPLRSPLNTEESTEAMGKDDWLMRLGDHGRTVITAVPPTAHAMSGSHLQHDPVDVKSLGDAVHFAAHQCARAESVRGDCAVSASDWIRAPRPNAWNLTPRSTRRPSPRTGEPTSTRSRAVTRQVRGQQLASGAPGSVRAVGSLGQCSTAHIQQLWLMRASDYACLDCCDETPNWQSRLNGISTASPGADLYTSTRIPDVERRPIHLPHRPTMDRSLP
jgi:hypothetical protein